ncbi:MAG: hypothetical protein R3D98_09590 [Candidatus Krumholzibacteriia bacterium]
MDEFILPASFLIVFGSLIALIGIQMTGKARRTARQVATPLDFDGPLGRGRAVAAAGWFVFLLGFLGLLAARLV